MSDFETTSSPRKEAAVETFCLYRAKQLIVNRGFTPGRVPETDPIAAQSDIVLSFSDGYSLINTALIDREMFPDKAFTMTPDELEAIG